MSLSSAGMSWVSGTEWVRTSIVNEVTPIPPPVGSNNTTVTWESREKNFLEGHGSQPQPILLEYLNIKMEWKSFRKVFLSLFILEPWVRYPISRGSIKKQRQRLILHKFKKAGRKRNLRNRMSTWRGRGVKWSLFKSGNACFYLKMLWKESVKNGRLSVPERTHCIKGKGPLGIRRLLTSEKGNVQGFWDGCGDEWGVALVTLSTYEVRLNHSNGL